MREKKGKVGGRQTTELLEWESKLKVIELQSCIHLVLFTQN
jgi:hypothetical protein